MTTFAWGDEGDDDTVFVMPLDCRAWALDLDDEVSVDNLLAQYVEYTSGGPRSSWESTRGTPIGPGMVLVRPWPQDGP